MIRRRISVALLAAGLAVLAASGPVGSAGAVPTVGPRSTAVTDQGRQQAGGNELSGRHSLRAPVTDETFYFVMADRFENGDTDNDRGGISGDRLQHVSIPLTGASTKAAISRACWTGSITYRA